ncbi:phosphopentomutase [Sneathiella chinensis]|uniref:Phosphopentomutase n=1 Tax=Sneathiella chinensis TaxID=349750 RepID=A0ABQ5U3F7_9PROT|nr:phosphopentomutase [Sneathiella chinensis]GLQ06200.1 phosphopentomutase [Sneathiella chinensis]
MSRAILLVLDSFGLGAARDADQFGDQGADTFGHIMEAARAGKADNEHRTGPLELPNLERLGLHAAHRAKTGGPVSNGVTPTGIYGYAQELSKGKDTPSGHWEMAGVPVLFDWGYFPKTVPCFPRALTETLKQVCNLPGFLGNCHASGTEIIERFGQEHMETGRPILYTSADSVLQIAAHEETFGLQRLYDLCAEARKLVDVLDIGRVIARPFIGEPGTFERTPNRKDLAVPPPEPTLLDVMTGAGRQVISVGKIGDIFAHQGTGEVVKAAGNMALFDATLAAFDRATPGSLVFTNFVDFDQSYGHRRNVAGYAQALEEFDARLPELLDRLQEDDLLLMTADHGCDPTWTGTDHTREVVPIVGFSRTHPSGFIGERDTFADIGQSIASHLGLPALRQGTSFVE